MSDDLDGPNATNPTGEEQNGVLHLDFDRRVMVQFRGSVVTSDAGLLAYRELDDVLGLSDLAGELLADGRTGKNGRHALVGMLRLSPHSPDDIAKSVSAKSVFAIIDK
jgi:hypothetical protein